MARILDLLRLLSALRQGLAYIGMQVLDQSWFQFQIMTLESWSMGIARPVMEVYPWAWAFFVPFILIATFTMLNLFIAIIVSTMQSMVEEQKNRETTEIGAVMHDETLHLHQAIRDLQGEVRSLREALRRDR